MGKKLQDITAPIAAKLQLVDDSIIRQLTTGIPILDQGAQHLFVRGGKRIRASVVLLASGLRGANPEGIVDLAAAAEIVHAATLVHDDIIDQAMFRRGDLAVSKKFGEKAAVLAGDYMYTMGLTTAVKYGVSDIFPVMVSGTSDMVKGELYQLEYSNIHSINEEHYNNIIELKTARFMATCAKIGAIMGGLNEAEQNDVWLFGLKIGLAFQIIDDTLDVAENESVTGKDSGNDFMDGKITLPFIHLLETLPAPERAALVEFAETPTQDKWPSVRKRIIEAGGVTYAHRAAQKLVDESVALLEQFPESDSRKILQDIAFFIVDRDF